jgi:uncharacterized protein (TIGR02996 family)
MTTADALLAAVIASPDDDLPRLVYADWLDEHGEPERAEFVRAQVELEQMESDPDQDRCYTKGTVCRDPRCPSLRWHMWQKALRLREGELLRLHAAAWVPGELVAVSPAAEVWFAFPGQAGHCVGRFGRGFLKSMTLPAAEWVRHADAVLARHPVRRVMFSEWPDEDSFGFNHEGVWLGEEDHGRIYPWADGEYPVRDRRVPIRRAFSSRWPGVGFEWPV